MPKNNRLRVIGGLLLAHFCQFVTADVIVDLKQGDSITVERVVGKPAIKIDGHLNDAV